MINTVIYKRNINWSILEYEMPIPIESQRIYEAVMGHPLEVGERHDIKLLIDGHLYDAHFRNEGFDRKVFNHNNIIMLKYGAEVRRKLQGIFSLSYKEMLERRATRRAEMESHGMQGRIIIEEPKNGEYIVLSTSLKPNVFCLDCITCDENNSASLEIRQMDEEIYEFETFSKRFDPNAHVEYSNSTHKVRKLDRSIGDSLKLLYDYRCQMTGEKVGDEYKALVVEAHHIIPFTESMNNDTSNIIILSPSYHRIIHKAKPVFDRSRLSFRFPNGLVEKVKIDKHLNV